MLAVAVLGSLIFSTHAAAVDPFVFNVNDNADEPDANLGDGTCSTAANKCTLRAAVMQANVIPNVNSTINVPAGTYKLGLPIDPNQGSLKFSPASGNPLITIVGAGEGLATIDGNMTDQVMRVNSGRRLNISGVSIVNGDAVGGGGGIYNAGTLNLTDVTIFNCTAYSGGGISNENGATLSLIRVTLNKNSAQVGGGITSNGPLSISHSLILDNVSNEDGGGISGAAQMSVDFSTVQGNKCQTNGGGIHTINSLTLSHSTLEGNQAGDQGGGLDAFGNTTVVDRSTIAGNTANIGGGARAGGSWIVTNSTISQNKARTDGGGIYNSGVANVYNSTIAYNQADSDANGTGDGGGVANASGTFNVRNSMLAGNLLAFDNSNSDCAGVIGFYGNNGYLGASDCFASVDSTGFLTQIDSVNELGILKNNGGPTETIALIPPSKMIGGGMLCADSNGGQIAVDQRDRPRPPSFDRCDIGAFEYNEVFASGFEVTPVP